MQDSVNNPVTIHFAPAAPQILPASKQKKTNKRQLKKAQTPVLSALAQ
jgi:hypothetical protein